jgi:hypothetical protein
MKEACELALGWIQIDTGCATQINGSVIAKTAESLKQCPVDRAERAVCSKAPIVSARF